MAETDTHRLRSTWPIHKRETKQLLIGYVVLVGLWIGFGELITGPLEGSVITRTDDRVAAWMVRHRTPTWNDLTVWGSYLAETSTKVIVTVVLALVLLLVWKRWLEPVVLLVSLSMEAAAFIVVTTVVDRGRPPVPHLDNSPVGSSFPSGHVAASMAYFAIAVIIFWHTRNRIARTLSVVVFSVVPIIVAASRMYRGMHYLSDVIGGVVLGGAAVALTVAVLRRSPEAIEALGDASDEHTRPGTVSETNDETVMTPASLATSTDGPVVPCRS